jgi:quinol monooxygenase YgiN
MAFTQIMTVQATSPEPLAALVEGWHREQAGVAPGYRAARVLADRDRPGRFLLEVDFSSEEEATENNDRPETQAWAQQLQGLAQDTPEYHNYEVAYSTG